MNITVVPPDVNCLRYEDFTVHDGKIYFGLAAIKGCGSEAPSDSIAAAPKKGGPFRDLFDFSPRRRSTRRRANRTAIESLIKSGAFDSLGGRRGANRLPAIDRALQAGASAAADRRQRAEGPLRRRRGRAARGRRQTTCPTCPSGTNATAWPRRRKCWASTCRAIRWPSTQKTLAAYCSHTHGRGRRAEAPRRGRCSAA